jgi:hypothetical protein
VIQRESECGGNFLKSPAQEGPICRAGPRAAGLLAALTGPALQAQSKASARLSLTGTGGLRDQQ